MTPRPKASVRRMWQSSDRYRSVHETRGDALRAAMFGTGTMRVLTPVAVVDMRPEAVQAMIEKATCVVERDRQMPFPSSEGIARNVMTALFGKLPPAK